MDIFEHLKQDHRKVLDLIEKIEATTDASVTTREELFTQLKDEIIKHSKAEEKTFYNRLLQFEEVQELIDEAKDDHKLVENLINEINNLAADDEEWMERFAELKENIEDHVEQEETEIFDEARKLLDEQESVRLEERFSKEERQVGTV